MKTEQEISDESWAGSKGVDGGLHVWLINMMFEEMSQVNPYEATMFNDKIGTLKGVRVKADYKNRDITPKQAHNAVRIAVEAQRLLKKAF